MKKTNKLLLTLGTAAAITAPVAAVVACGTHAIATNGASDTQVIIGPSNIVKTPAQIAAEKVHKEEMDKFKSQIGDLYRQLESKVQSADNDDNNKEVLKDLRKQIAELKLKLDDLGYQAKRNVLVFNNTKADLSITDASKAQDQINMLADGIAKLGAAVDGATTLEEMKAYYPQYISIQDEIAKARKLLEDIKNPPVPANKAKEYKVTDEVKKVFTDYFKDFLAKDIPVTTYSDFKSDPSNVLAPIGGVFGSSKGDDAKLNTFSAEEGDVRQKDSVVGLGIQKFDLDQGLSAHIDIKYDIKKPLDKSSITSFFGSDPLGYPLKTIMSVVKYAETEKEGSGLKVFPYVYTDEENPGYIHFALFAYKTEAPKVATPKTSGKYTDDLADFNGFRRAYDEKTPKGESIRRGVKILSDAVGRDVSLKENYYTTDNDFISIMKNLYYAPKRDEMQYINNHISDADRISLFEQLFDGGGFNVMASGRVYGVDPEKLYSAGDGGYSPTITMKGTFIDDVEKLNIAKTPKFQTQTLAEEKDAAKKYHESESFHTSSGYLDQKTPGRELPSLAQNSLDFSTGMFYDLGGQIPFERDSSGKIVGIKNVNYDDASSVQRIDDLHEAMYAMTQDKSESAIYYMGLTSWPRGETGRINPFLHGLKINYITVRNKQNPSDLDLVLKASRGDKDLPVLKMVIPEGAMNWKQVDEAVKDSPVYSIQKNTPLSKDDFEFIMMKVMAKWVDGGDAVAQYILPSVSKLLSEGLKRTLSLDEIDKYYDILKDDSSVDLYRLKELVTNPNIDFMDVFLSEAWDSQSRKVLYTKYGENLLNIIGKISKAQILANPDDVDQNIIDSLSNEFEGL